MIEEHTGRMGDLEVVPDLVVVFGTDTFHALVRGPEGNRTACSAQAVYRQRLNVVPRSYVEAEGFRKCDRCWRPASDYPA